MFFPLRPFEQMSLIAKKLLITKDILKLAGIRYCVLDNKKKFKFLDKLLKYSRKNNTPVACLVKKNIFYKEKKKSKNYKKNNNLIERNFFIKELIDNAKNFKIISTTGYISRDLHDQSSDIQKRNNFYKYFYFNVYRIKIFPLWIICYSLFGIKCLFWNL